MNSNENIVDELKNEITGKKIVHWNYRGLEKLPDAVRHCAKDIQEIYLKENHLSNLPNWLIELASLTHLYLAGNCLKQFPSQLTAMTHLTLLDLSNNGLSDLPASLGKLESLQVLTLDKNYLKKLPPEMNQLKNLQSLSLCDNEFIVLPEWLGSLDELEQLKIDGNLLRELPNRLTMSRNLRILSIRSNRLTYLPFNGFISRPSIYFYSNPHLNYLSHRMYHELIDNPGSRDLEVGKCCSQQHRENTGKICGLHVSIRLHNVENIMIELPRQLLKVHGVYENEPISMWELGLRKVYSLQRNTGITEKDIRNLGVSYNLFANGPIAVCVNSNCHEWIFTESWLIVGISCPQDSDCKGMTIVAPYCCQNCALTFEPITEGFESLRWNLVHQ